MAETVAYTKHTKEMVGHVTEAFVIDTMKAEGLSREAAEHKAPHQHRT